MTGCENLDITGFRWAESIHHDHSEEQVVFVIGVILGRGTDTLSGR